MSEESKPTEGLMTNYFRCPSCFMNWAEKCAHRPFRTDTQDKLCDYCSLHHPKKKDLLFRMVEVMNSAYASDLPSVIRLLLESVEFREEDYEEKE